MITDQMVKDAATEYLSHKGERPYRVLRSGQELWETHAAAMRAALTAALGDAAVVPRDVITDLLSMPDVQSRLRTLDLGIGTKTSEGVWLRLRAAASSVTRQAGETP